MMGLQLTPPRQALGLVLQILAIALLIVLIEYGQLLLMGSSPQPRVWVLGTIVVVIVTLRAVFKRQ